MRIYNLYNRLFVIILTLGFLFAWHGKWAWAVVPTAGKVVSFSGSVFVSSDKGKSWSGARLNEPLPEGACIRTDKNGQAALLLNDHSQIRLRANSTFCLKKGGSAPGIRPVSRGIYNLLKGKAWFRNKRKGPKPLFETPVVTASIRGTEMVLYVDDTGKRSQVTVLEGIVQASNDVGEAVIKRGEAASTVKGKAPSIVKLARPEDSAQWLILTPEIKGPKDELITDGKTMLAVMAAQDAMKNMAEGKMDRAMKIMEGTIKLCPENASVNVAMATILQANGRFEEALQYAKKAYAVDPKSIPALVRKAELLLGLDRIEEAKAVINGFGGSEDARIHLLSASIALIEDDMERAVKEFKTAISIEPSLGSAHLGLGLALYRQGNFDAGLEEMEKASLLDPFAAYPHNYLAKALYERGERHEAEIELKRAMQLDPRDPTPHLYLSIIMADEYRAGEGVIEIQKAIRMNGNRLATRSRYLLDQDKAIKNVSLAWSLADMGLTEWARAMGDMAVWTDPTNSGAYLFRAAQSVAGGSIDAQTLGDARRATLLKPVNSNTYITYTEYQSLLELPKIKGSIVASIGNDDTFSSKGFITGGVKGAAFYADAAYSTTDGPVDDSGEAVTQGLVRVKTDILKGHQIVLEGIAGHRHEEDLDPWRFEDIEPENKAMGLDYYNLLLGYHWRQGAGKDLLLNFQVQGSDGELKWRNPSSMSFLKHLKSEPYLETWRIEGIELYRLNDHRVSVGGVLEDGYISRHNGYYYLDAFMVPPVWMGSSDHRRERRAFIRDVWVKGRLMLVGGISYCWLDGVWQDGNGDEMRREEALPEVGLSFNLTRKDVLRAAYFQEIQPNYLGGSLQPMEVAGFKKVTGVTPGTWTWFYGIGWDRYWSERVFSRIELSRAERRYPAEFSPYINALSPLSSWKDDDVNMLRTSINGLITERLAVEFSVRVIDFEAESPDRERDDIDLGIRVTYVHPLGIKAQVAGWFVSQDEDDNFGQDAGDDFFIGSFSIEKTLFDKKGLIFLNIQNITDEEYRYLILENTEATQLPWQGFLGQIGFRWNF